MTCRDRGELEKVSYDEGDELACRSHAVTGDTKKSQQGAPFGRQGRQMLGDGGAELRDTYSHDKQELQDMCQGMV